MDRPVGNIKITKTENGFNLDIEGKYLKDLMSSCCFCGTDDSSKSDCCPTASPEADQS